MVPDLFLAQTPFLRDFVLLFLLAHNKAPESALSH